MNNNNDKLNQMSSVHYNNMTEYQKNKWLVYVVELIEQQIKDWKSWMKQMGLSQYQLKLITHSYEESDMLYQAIVKLLESSPHSFNLIVAELTELGKYFFMLFNKCSMKSIFIKKKNNLLDFSSRKK